MLVQDWCHCAQADQNAHGQGHLYANFRHSLKRNLLRARGIADFGASLDYLVSEGFLLDPSTPCASQAVYEADKARHRAPSPIDDFRLCGPIIESLTTDTFLNIDFFPITTSSTGVSGRGGRGFRPRPHGIKWLTTRAETETLLKSAVAKNGPLDEISFFRELISALGLKARDDDPSAAIDYSCGVNLFQLKRDKELYRPHALSTGYEDRFCGVSPKRPFGSTADNRNGKAGLPEAITSDMSLIRLEPSSTPYIDFKGKVSTYAPWLTTRLGGIDAVVSGPELFSEDLTYPELKPIILKRLKEVPENCGAATSSCYCYTGTIS